MHTDGQRWKLYEVHRTHVKKTKFFTPDPSSRINNPLLKSVKFTRDPRFFDDHEHMLSVIGMIRFAMGIKENIVLGNQAYEVEELPSELDPERTIQRSLLSQNSQTISQPLIMGSSNDELPSPEQQYRDVKRLGQ